MCCRGGTAWVCVSDHKEGGDDGEEEADVSVCDPGDAQGWDQVHKRETTETERDVHEADRGVYHSAEGPGGESSARGRHFCRGERQKGFGSRTGSDFVTRKRKLR